MSPKRWSMSLRARLLMASVLVEAITLILLIANSARLIERSLLDELSQRLEQTQPLLNAALVGPLAQRDFATIRQIIHESRDEKGIRYLVVMDHLNRVVAAEGHAADKALPQPDRFDSFDPGRPDQCLHARTDITMGGQRLGSLHFGLSTHFLAIERARLVRESLELGAGALLLSFVALGSVGLWLTRRLTRLTEASAQLSAGDYELHLPVAGHDEVDQLSRAFSQMAATIKGRVEELTRAEALQRQYLDGAQEERARLASLLAALKTGILFVNNQGIVVYYNASFGHIWLIPPNAQLVGEPAQRLHAFAGRLLPADQGGIVVAASDTQGESPATEFRLLDRRIVTQTTYPVLNEKGESVGHLWIYEDVTHQRLTAERADQAERDALTGLFNRRGFEHELLRLTRQCDERKGRLALFFIDLDGFKCINDGYGHRAGDAILVQVAGEFQAQIRRNEFLARLGGDEFAVLVPDVSPEEITALADRMVKAIAGLPIRHTGQDIRIGCSIGIALYPLHTQNPEELVALADGAMYHAKQAGKNRWQLVGGQRPDSP